MPVKLVWDEMARENYEMPSEMKAFLEEIQGVYRKYGLSLAHEDAHGAFLVELMDESNVQWLMSASQKLHPANGSGYRCAAAAKVLRQRLRSKGQELWELPVSGLLL